MILKRKDKSNKQNDQLQARKKLIHEINLGISSSSRWEIALIYIKEFFKIVVISLAIIIPIRYFLIQPFYVKGASMEPSYYDHEYLIIDEITYRFRPPQRGEVVVFRYPLDPKEYFIKRLIGLPGEHIEIESGQIFIYNDFFPNGIKLNENYLPAGLITVGNYSVDLQADEYFVLGDNRFQSLDSRRFGVLPRNYIIGKTLLRGWPLNRLGTLKAPEYNF